MNEVIEQYTKWKAEHDEGYCYDEIGEFLSQVSRGDLISIMDYVEKNIARKRDNK